MGGFKMRFPNSSMKLIFLIAGLVGIAGCTAQFSGARPSFDPSGYQYSYNSPDLNIYWNQTAQPNILTVRGAIENIYFTDIINLHLYVDILDSEEKVISTRNETIVTLNPYQADTFILKFPLNKKPHFIRFSFLK